MNFFEKTLEKSSQNNKGFAKIGTTITSIALAASLIACWEQGISKKQNDMGASFWKKSSVKDEEAFPWQKLYGTIHSDAPYSSNAFEHVNVPQPTPLTTKQLMLEEVITLSIPPVPSDVFIESMILEISPLLPTFVAPDFIVVKNVPYPVKGQDWIITVKAQLYPPVPIAFDSPRSREGELQVSLLYYSPKMNWKTPAVNAHVEIKDIKYIKKSS